MTHPVGEALREYFQAAEKLDRAVIFQCGVDGAKKKLYQVSEDLEKALTALVDARIKAVVEAKIKS